VLTGPDMTAREVPHTWIPPPLRRAVAQQNLVSLERRRITATTW
jgi:hypothetical protein